MKFLLSGSAAIILTKVFNFLKELYFANKVGTSLEADSYFSILILLGVSQIASNTIHDKLNSELKDISSGKRVEVVNNLSYIITLPMLIITTFMLLISDDFNIHDNQFFIAISLFLVMVVRINIMNYYACLKSQGSGFLTILLPSVPNLFLILVIYIYESIELHQLLGAFALGSIAEFLIVQAILNKNIKNLDSLNADDEIFKYINLFKSGITLLPATIIVTIVPIIELEFLHKKGPGAVAINAYSQRIPMALSGLLLIYINTYAVNHMKREISNHGSGNYFKNMMKPRYIAMLAVAIPVGLLLSYIISTIVYSDHSFSRDALYKIRFQQTFFFFAFLLVALTSYLGKYLIITGQEKKLTLFIIIQALITWSTLLIFENFFFSVPLSNCLTSLIFIVMFYFRGNLRVKN